MYKAASTAAWLVRWQGKGFMLKLRPSCQRPRSTVARSAEPMPWPMVDHFRKELQSVVLLPAHRDLAGLEPCDKLRDDALQCRDGMGHTFVINERRIRQGLCPCIHLHIAFLDGEDFPLAQ